MLFFLYLLFYFFYFLFWSIDRLENELLEKFQDLDFEDLEQQQVRELGKCPWCIFDLFLILSIGLHAVKLESHVSYPSMIYPCYLVRVVS
jgi:hypothetical protein